MNRCFVWLLAGILTVMAFASVTRAQVFQNDVIYRIVPDAPQVQMEDLPEWMAAFDDSQWPANTERYKVIEVTAEGEADVTAFTTWQVYGGREGWPQATILSPGVLISPGRHWTWLRVVMPDGKGQRFLARRFNEPIPPVEEAPPRFEQPTPEEQGAQMKMNTAAMLDRLRLDYGIPTMPIRNAIADDVKFRPDRDLGAGLGSWIGNENDRALTDSRLISLSWGGVRAAFTDDLLVVFKRPEAIALYDDLTFTQDGMITPLGRLAFHESLHVLIHKNDIEFTQCDVNGDGQVDPRRDVEEHFVHQLDLMLIDFIDLMKLARMEYWTEADFTRYRTILERIRLQLESLRLLDPEAFRFLMESLGWKDEDRDGLPDWLEDRLRDRGINPDDPASRRPAPPTNP